MKLYKFHQEIIDWTKDYMSFRSGFVEIRGKKSLIRPTYLGVPQGSVLGPLLFTLFSNELADTVKSRGCPLQHQAQVDLQLFGPNCENCGLITTYADDLTIQTAGKSRIELAGKINEKVDKLEALLTSNQLVVNKDKTKLMEIMLHQKRSKIGGILPSIQTTDRAGEPITLSTVRSVRVLGLNISEDTTWRYHLESGPKAILPATRRLLGALRCNSHLMNRSSRQLVCNGVIPVKAELHGPVMGGGAPDNWIDRAQVTLNTAARYITRLPRATRQATLMRECNWLDIRGLTKYHSLMVVWKTNFFKTPQNLLDQLRLDANKMIPEVQCRLLNTRRGFIGRIAAQWNGLPLEIRSSTKIGGFKRRLKKFLMGIPQ